MSEFRAQMQRDSAEIKTIENQIQLHQDQIDIH